MRSRPFIAAGLIWFVIAFMLTAAGGVARLRPPAPQVLIVALTVALIVAGATIPTFKAWLGTLSLRWVLAFHLNRFIGAYFLALHARGELPYAFAVPGGWGDIVTASLALILLLTNLRREPPRAAMLAWNVLGFGDILFVVVTAARLALADPASMSALLRMPLGLLPTFVVPVIIASHVFVFRRLLAPSSGPPAS